MAAADRTVRNGVGGAAEAFSTLWTGGRRCGLGLRLAERLPSLHRLQSFL